MAEEVKEYAIGALKGAIGAIPLVGTMLNELAFEARSRLKQQRINRFVTMVSESMSALSGNKIDLDKINKDELSDIFESILLRVSRTSSERKLIVFKSILMSQFTKDMPSSHVDKFIQITETLSDNQLKILGASRQFFSAEMSEEDSLLKRMQEDIKNLNVLLERERQDARSGYANNVSSVTKKLNDEIERATALQMRISSRRDVMNPDALGMSFDDYVIETQDLVAKGLVVDMGDSFNIVRKGETFALTRLGEAYVEYVLNTG